MLAVLLFLHEKNCGTHYKYLIELLLMSTHNICFHGEIRKKTYLSEYSSELEVGKIQVDSKYLDYTDALCGYST